MEAGQGKALWHTTEHWRVAHQVGCEVFNSLILNFCQVQFEMLIAHIKCRFFFRFTNQSF